VHTLWREEIDGKKEWKTLTLRRSVRRWHKKGRKREKCKKIRERESEV